MREGSKKQSFGQAVQAGVLAGLIHLAVRKAIEEAVEEELAVALGAQRYERLGERRGYRNGRRRRTLTGPTGPAELTVPRATLFRRGGEEEWRSTLVPRYQRRMTEVNEAIVGAYLSGANTRRLRGALKPLLKNAPLSRSSVSRVVSTLKSSFDEWCRRSLAGLDVVYLFLDAIALRVRRASKVVGAPVLVAIAVLSDGSKQVLSLEMVGSESHGAWKGFLDDLVARGLKAPLLSVIDGNAGLRRAVAEVWPRAQVQRCTVHKLRNLKRKAPDHVHDEIADDYHRIVYADDRSAARVAYAAFVRKWRGQVPGVVRSLEEGGDELLTFFDFPREQWKTLRTTNVAERLNEEFRRRVKTQGALPGEDSALVLLFALIASGQIKLRKLDGHHRIAAVLSGRMKRAA
jgi:transposase-like protein